METMSLVTIWWDKAPFLPGLPILTNNLTHLAELLFCCLNYKHAVSISLIQNGTEEMDQIISCIREALCKTALKLAQLRSGEISLCKEILACFYATPHLVARAGSIIARSGMWTEQPFFGNPSLFQWALRLVLSGTQSGLESWTGAE